MHGRVLSVLPVWLYQLITTSNQEKPLPGENAQPRFRSCSRRHSGETKQVLSRPLCAFNSVLCRLSTNSLPAVGGRSSFEQIRGYLSSGIATALEQCCLELQKRARQLVRMNDVSATVSSVCIHNPTPAISGNGAAIAP